jgi:hypothetical protein
LVSNNKKVTSTTEAYMMYTSTVWVNRAGPTTGMFESPGMALGCNTTGLFSVSCLSCGIWSYRKLVMPPANTTRTTPSTIWLTR